MSVPAAPSSIALPSGLPLAGAPPDDPAKVRELAHEFESMLLLQMLRQMRRTTAFGDEPESQDAGLGGDALTDTMDTELARQLSLAGGLGIADLIVEALEHQQQAAGAPSPPQATPHALDPRAHAGAASRPSPAVAAPARSPAGRHIGRTPAAAPPPPVSETVPAAVGEPSLPGPAPGLRSGAVPLPIAAHLTSRYGWRADPMNGQMRFHSGVDVRAAYGLEVPSAAAGRVVWAGEHGGYGLMVVVEHAPGLQTRYAHLSASLVRAGDEVGAGQPIGRVGSSGRSTGPHLHFEVVKDGRRIDPELAAARFAALGQFKNPGAGADSPNGGDPQPATEE